MRQVSSRPAAMQRLRDFHDNQDKARREAEVNTAGQLQQQFPEMTWGEAIYNATLLVRKDERG